MIEAVEPAHWRDLQNQVARILDECGLEVSVDRKIKTARGHVVVDVFAKDPEQQPRAVYLCECKHWHRRVPKTVVHAFRTVVTDFGANWGLIISSAGFQGGAQAAGRYTNIRLLTWKNFQALFAERWYECHMVRRVRSAADPLLEYTEPVNSRIFRKANLLPARRRKTFAKLRQQYETLAFLAAMISGRLGPFSGRPRLPLLPALPPGNSLPVDLTTAVGLRQFLDLYLRHVGKAIAQFDTVFGGRA